MTVLELVGQILFAAGFFRYLGIAAVFPFPEGALHGGARLGLALALSLSGIENTAEASKTIFSPADTVVEFFFGMLLGAPLLVLWFGWRMWGDLFESLRGHQIGVVIDPLSRSEEPAFATLLSQVLFIGLLVRTTLPGVLLMAMRSSEEAGPGELSQALLVRKAETIFELLSGILQGVMCLLLPYLLIVFGIELAMALVSRVAGGLSVGSEGYLLRLIAMVFFVWIDADTLSNAFLTLLYPAV